MLSIASLVTAVLAGLAGAPPGGGGEAGNDPAGAVLAAAGVRAGLIVHLACTDGMLTAGLARGGRTVVHALALDPASVAGARRLLQARRLYGRASVEALAGGRLPYADNLVNLVVAEDLTGLVKAGVTVGEIMRTVRPGGVALLGGPEESELKATLAAARLDSVKPAGIGEVVIVRGGGTWARLVKPWPAGVDEWTHARHGPDNNPVSTDQVAGPPFRVQWIAEPKRNTVWHSIGCGVVAVGRLVFSDYVLDEQERAVSQVIRCVDACNGFLLWELRNPTNRLTSQDVHRGTLVAAGGRLFNIGHGAGCQVIDLAGGKVQGAYGAPGSPAAAWEYLAFHNGLLFGVAGGRGGAALFALDPADGKPRWRQDLPAAFNGGTLCIGDGKVFFQAADQWKTDPGGFVTALEAATGKGLWKNSDEAVRSRFRDAVYHAGTLTLAIRSEISPWVKKDPGFAVALSAEDGRVIWQTKRSMGNMAIISGFRLGEYLCGTWYNPGPQQIRLHDPATGEIIERIQTPLYRCMPVTGMRDWVFYGGGIHALNVRTKEHYYYTAFRSTCQTGIIHGGGMTYAMPNDCMCNHSVKGMVGLAPAGTWRPGEGGEDPAGRLEKGPAYGSPPGPPAGEDDWPRFRRDAAHSAATPARVDLPVRRLWAARVDGTPTSPAIAGGLAVVGTSDGIVCAFDAATGRALWTHTAGGAVRVTPALYKGLVLFGADDGLVTCLRAADGELVWRFRAAPRERLVLVHERLASSWPVASGVLVDRDVAYFCAGRCGFEGAWLFALEPATGKELWKNCSVGAVAGKGVKKKDEQYSYLDSQGGFGFSPDGAMAAAGEDLVVPCGYAAHVYVSRSGKKTQPIVATNLGPKLGGNRLIVNGNWVVAGMDPMGRDLKEAWRAGGIYFFHEPKNYQFKGQRVEVKGAAQLEEVQKKGAHGERFKTIVYCGPLIFTADRAYGTIWRAGGSDITASTASNMEHRPVAERVNTRLTFDVRWVVSAPMTVQASVLASGTLLCAGDRAAKGAGEAAGLLWALDGADGKRLAEIAFDGPVVADGMAAAGGRLYLVTEDGGLLCLGNK